MLVLSKLSQTYHILRNQLLYKGSSWKAHWLTLIRRANRAACSASRDCTSTSSTGAIKRNASKHPSMVFLSLWRCARISATQSAFVTRTPRNTAQAFKANSHLCNAYSHNASHFRTQNKLKKLVTRPRNVSISTGAKQKPPLPITEWRRGGKTASFFRELVTIASRHELAARLWITELLDKFFRNDAIKPWISLSLTNIPKAANIFWNWR